jgi:hypothetical protein
MVRNRLARGRHGGDGVPYSENTVVTGYFDRLTAEGSDRIFVPS